MRKQKGFTLIELMVTLIIVGILGAIAYPDYMEYVRSARRTAAMSCLMEQTHFMERYHSANMTYAGAAPPACPGAVTDYYTVATTNLTGVTYTLTATRTGAQTNDPCGNFQITQAGKRTNPGATVSSSNCWR